MDIDLAVKVEVYRATAATGRPPSAGDVARALGLTLPRVREAFASVAARRLLVLEPDGVTIRMAPPFSGVPTQHLVVVDGREYFANCAWDALAIPAALRRPGVVNSRCEQSAEPLRLAVGIDGPERSPWWFHCEVPAARWWEDIVYT